MGSGKTTVGRILAGNLGWEFVDLDDRIELAAGKPIPEIFDADGEPAFREIEHQQLRTVLQDGGGEVVALGGGAFVEPRNSELIARSGAFTVWLDVPPEILRQRCAHATNRPLARDPAQFDRLYQERLPFYSRAQLRVDATVTPLNVVEEIVAALRARGKE
jgi:shikimate kinase